MERWPGTIPHTTKGTDTSQGRKGGSQVVAKYRRDRGHSLGSSPAILPGYNFEARRVPDHLVEGANHLGEARPCIPVLLPTVQHELVQGGGAVWGWGQPVVLFNGIDYLK